jgi:K+-sensing histidine kinase KdpD
MQKTNIAYTSMKSAPSQKLRNIRILMILSFSLLVAFSAHWLSSQYDREKNQLQKDLTKLFNNVQEDISDSLLWLNVVQPVLHAPVCEDSTRRSYEEFATFRQGQVNEQGTRMLLKNVKKLSKSEEKQLFRSDTIVFNDIFNQRMQSQGWDFTSKWVHASDTNKEEAKNNIVIMSRFFTNEHGVIISNYQPYLTRRMLTPCLFVIFLLAITGIAFRTTYISLKKQMSLATLKDDFISNMSHELKTPVATVKVALEALYSFNALQQPERSREYLEMAVMEMNRLELLVNRALSTSLLESGRLSLQKEKTDLKKLTEEVIWGMQPRLLQHEAKVILETTGSNFISLLDKLHTQGVLINLIDNSIKYANRPAEIKIQLTEEQDSIQLSVTDNGPGIPEEYRERVFEKFFRVPAGNKHNTKGYGLGLSYAAQVMQQHMGSIRVANLPQGGCRFTLTF